VSRRGPAASFRDPAGFVFERDGTLFRQVDPSFGPHYDRLIASGLYDRLTDQGLLVPHQEVSADMAAVPGAHRVLRPEAVPFVSYPYEWCFGQLRDAALLTLRVQRVALRHGMSLRDASAYNVQFRGSRPVLIDTLSFEVLREGEPWVAYPQFCRHFLAPLALMAARDVRLGQLLRVHLDGVPLDLAAATLPRRSRLRPGILLHLALHARAQRRHAGDDPEGRRPARRFGPRAFQGLVESLERSVRRLRWDPPPTVWGEYYADCRTYPPPALRRKEEVVSTFLQEAGPRVVWDLGANTGRFSRLAADRGALAVSLDADPGCVEEAYRELASEEGTRILPLVMDLTNPSPRIGWDAGERMSLADRGPADAVLALALIHHLAIGNAVPLDRLAATLAGWGRWLVIEFVPPSDPQVRRLLATRRESHPGYSVQGFERAFARRFEIVRREDLPGSDRALYLMRSR
jgi:SAM-dependent methyltransferase